MILFASGRTDIPAYYSEWFFNRVKEKFVLVRNPYYSEQVTRYSIDPSVVDCIVFCTKNVRPMMSRLEEIASFGKYFFVTITPYGKDVEPNVPDKNTVMDDFIELSKIVGKDHICWRYDPVFVNADYPPSFHIREFRRMAEKLSGYTDRCIVSFVDLYEKTKKNFPGIKEVGKEDQTFLARAFSFIAQGTKIQLSMCAEATDFSAYGIERSGCVNGKIISAASGYRILPQKPSPLRKNCSCLPMHDIGAYNTCPHLCKYCYANYNADVVKKNFALHDPLSPFLIGGPKKGDVIKDAQQESWKDIQGVLF